LNSIFKKAFVSELLIELQYLPPISYFSLIQGVDKLYVEKFEHYEKQTYRNRCYIKTAQGVEILIVPLTGKHGKTLMKDVRIDYSQKWLNSHWRAIQSAYGNAPFFEFYSDDLHQILFKKHEFLCDLNMAVLTMCLKWLKYNITVAETTSYEKHPSGSITDFRSVLNPKKEDSCNRFFKSVEYHQVFGAKFVQNLSIIDLIFCEGPGALKIVRASVL
jgi:hypothetical protein